MKKVLIIGETAASEKLLKKHLTSLGYTVVGAVTNGRDAVNTARESHPDAILMDIDIPGEFGGAQAVSQIARELDIPVIVIADRADDELIAKARDAGVKGFLLKPVNPGQLKAAVEIAVGDKGTRIELTDLFHDLIENTNDLVYITDGKGNIRYFNNRVSEKLGYAYQDIIGRSFSDFINPRSFKNASEIFGRQLKGEDVGAFEIELVDRDGGIKTIETRETLKWEKGRIVEVYGIGRDITIRKRAEEALRREKDSVRQYLDIAGVMILVLDTSGTVTLINKRGCEILGYTEDEILGKNWFDNFLPKEVIKEVREVFSHIIAGRNPEHYRYQEGVILCRDGSEKRIAWHNTIVSDREGKNVATLSSGEDITERLRAEKELLLNERRLEGLLQLTQMKAASETEIIRFALEQGVELTGSAIGYFHFVNPNQIDLSLFTWSNDVYKSCTAQKDDKYPIEAAGVWIDSFRRRKPIIHNDYQNLRDKKGYPDGHIHVTRHMSIPVFDGEIIVAVAGVGNKKEPYTETDIRQLSVFMNNMWEILRRKRAEEALSESEEKYRDIFESAIEGIFQTTQEGRFLSVNPSFVRMLGYDTPEELISAMTDIGRQLYVDPHKRKEIQDLLTRQGRIRNFEFQSYRKDGSTAWVSIDVAAIRDESGAIHHYQGVVLDIDERKRIEEALRQSEEKFRSLFETSRDVVYISTVEGRFLDINPATEETFGYTREELLTINVQDLYKDPTQRERFKSAVAERSFVQDFEVQMKKRDGSIIDCLITGTVRRDTEGAIIGYQGIIRDITERLRLRRQVIQTEKLSSLGAMISGVAHEINNPLTSIIGNAQLLMRKDIPPDFRKKLEVIKRESVRCTKIVAGLLSFAREHRPERRMTDVNAVVVESLRLKEYDLKVNNVRVDMDLAGDLPQTSADPYQLQQVFINLINNSHDALREKGGGALSIRSFLKDSSICVVFADDGPGIEPGDLNRIFDPFFTTKDVGKGTGLGLSVAYGIINEHGGTIGVESRPGKGVEFVVTIPFIGSSSIEDKPDRID